MSTCAKFDGNSLTAYKFKL